MSSEPEPTEGDLLPIESKWLHSAFYALIGLWIVYLLANMGGWRPEDQTVPVIVGVPGILLALLYLFRIQFPVTFARLNPMVQPDAGDGDAEGQMADLAGDFGDSTETESDRSPRERQWIELLMIGWVIALPIVMQYLGFFVALPLYVFAFGLYFTGDLKRSAIISVLFTLFVYVFFVAILGAKVYPGDLGIQPDLPQFSLT